METKNGVATALKIIAWIFFICGFIGGGVLSLKEETIGVYYTHTETVFSLESALLYWAVSLISGIMMLGFAEIINLLEAIKNK